MIKSGHILIFMLSLLAFPAFAQQGVLKGTISDSTTKSTLIGAKVFVLGTSYRALTDIDGNFTIQDIPAGKYQIEASYSGYISSKSEVEITAQSETNVVILLSDKIKEF